MNTLKYYANPQPVFDWMLLSTIPVCGKLEETMIYGDIPLIKKVMISGDRCLQFEKKNGCKNYIKSLLKKDIL